MKRLKNYLINSFSKFFFIGLYLYKRPKKKMPNYKIFKEEEDFDCFCIQKPIEVKKEGEYFSIPRYEDDVFFYESTTTFNRRYWSLHRAIDSGIYQIVKDMIKFLNFTHEGLWRIDYVVEYHKDGFPHFHCQVMTKIDIRPEDQMNLQRKLSRKYGRTDWYQTNKKDYLHEKIIEGKNTMVKWSDYIRKDLKNNERNGCKHGFTITSNPSIY